MRQTPSCRCLYHPAGNRVQKCPNFEHLGRNENDGEDCSTAIRIAPDVAERHGRALGRGGSVVGRGTRPEYGTREPWRASQFSRQPALSRSGLAGTAAGRGHRTGVGDRRSSPSSLGPPRQPVSHRPTARRHRQRPQHHPNRFYRVRLDVPRRRPGRNEASRRDRVRQRDGGDERQWPVWADAALPRHRRPCRFAIG